MKKIYGRLMLIVLISVMLFLCVFAVQAKAANAPFYVGNAMPQQEVRGIVSDQSGMPLPGVTVIVKGENRGTTTDIDGKYSITIEPEDILIFSFIGFKPHEEPVNGRREIMIAMEEDISSLGEVQINAGYYSTTKRESTGNISRVTAEEIELQPVISPIQALQGRMAGVEIVPGGSHPGMASTIRIRGQNSLREDGNFPLYIIDGVPINSTPVESNSLLRTSGIDPLNNLNISNIESIEVLKDADATAIYGSRGANGVILITTKVGKQQGTQVESQIYTGVATVAGRLDLLNTPQYLEIRRNAFENDGVEPTINNAYDLVLWDQDRYTDWQDLVFGGTAQTTNANIAVSGGNENTFFRLGGSHFTQGTVYPGDYSYQKVTGNLNLNHTSENKKFKINLSINYGVDINKLVGNLNLSSNVFLLPPNAPSIFNNDGTLNWVDWGEAGLNNPFAGFYNSSTTRSNNFLSNLGLSYEIIEGLSFRSSFGYTFYDSEEVWKRPIRSYNPSFQETHNSFHLNSNRKSWIIEPQLIYSKSIGKLNLETIVGTTFQENTSNQVKLQGTGYVAEALIGNLAAAEDVINASSQMVEYRYSALFARFGFNWDRKYYLNLTGRRDGSSRFGPDNRFSNFGAIGAAWIFTEEDIIKNTLPFLSFGKFRGSYGTAGNDQIGDYGFLDAYEATPGPGGLYPTALSNSEFSWEVNKKLEAAVEFGFLKDHINFAFSYYRNRSSNQLVGYPLPATTGFTSVQANLPATVQNTGLELEASSINLDTENFRWQTSFNVSFPRNELISYPDLEQSSYANTYRLGNPLNISLRYQYSGLDPETGFYTIQDVNDDGRYDYEDRIVVQDHNREFFGGINNNLTYKNFSLQFLWEFVKQEGNFALFNTGRPSNLHNVALQALGGESGYQKISQSTQANTAYNRLLDTSFFIDDASFLRLKSLSLAYVFPRGVLQRIGVANLKLFMHAQNLVTITSFEGLDPEFPYSDTTVGGLRTITGGFQFNL